MVLSFTDLFESEVVDDMIGEGGVGGVRGMRVASAASVVKVGEAFRRGRDEVDDSYDGGEGTSMSTIVTSLLDRIEPNEDVDVLVS